ncbi:MAG: hypothetical protein WA040_03265, partial [Anaerolineae bacterium]
MTTAPGGPSACQERLSITERLGRTASSASQLCLLKRCLLLAAQGVAGAQGQHRRGQRAQR